MAGRGASKIVSANDLLSGRVVYLTAEGAWSPDIADASVAPDPAAASALLAAGERDPGRVVGPYLVDVTPGGPDRGPEPTAIRERIRLLGPSVGPRPEAGS